MSGKQYAVSGKRYAVGSERYAVSGYQHPRGMQISVEKLGRVHAKRQKTLMFPETFSPERAPLNSIGQRPMKRMAEILSPERAQFNSTGHRPVLRMIEIASPVRAASMERMPFDVALTGLRYHTHPNVGRCPTLLSYALSGLRSSAKDFKIRA